MIVDLQLRAKTAGSVSLALFICTFAAIALAGGNADATWSIVISLLSLSCGIALVTALWFHLGAKARSKAWLLMLAFNIIGLAVIIGLTDRSNE
jgi:hypothetical protein